MKDIYVLIGRLCQGGGERVCVNLCNELASRGYNVNLCVFSDDIVFFKDDISENVLLHEFSSGRMIARIIDFYWFFKGRTKSVKYSVISFNYNISFYLSILKLLFGIRYTSRSLNTLSLEFSTRLGIKNKIIKKMVLFGLNMSDVIVSQSEGMKQDLIRSGVTSKINVINNPLNDKFLVMDIAKKDKFIIFVGRLTEQKGLSYLLHAFKEVNDDYRLFLLGDGEEKKKLISMADQLGVINRIDFLGQVDNVEVYYRQAKLTVLSSIYEGFPNVLIESIASGTPVVSFDCPSGPSEIIVDGVNGFLAEYLDSDDLARKINKAIDYNFDHQLLINSIEKFRTSVIVDRYINEAL